MTEPLQALLGLNGLWQAEALAAHVLRASIVLAAGAVLASGLSGSSGGERRGTWGLTLFALLALPLLSLGVPDWPLAIDLPRWMARVDNVPALDGLRLELAEVVAPDLAALAAGTDDPTTRGPGPWAWLFVGWLAGVGFVLARLGAGIARLAAYARVARPITEPRATAALQRAREALGIRRSIDLVESDAFDVPAQFGYRRARIVLPPGWRDWDGGLLRMAIFHEAAHVRRADWLAQLGSVLACALYWFHPAVWAAARRRGHEAELVADREVLGAGFDRYDYARGVLQVLAGAGRAPPHPTLSLPLARRSGIESRLQRLLRGERPPRSRRRTAATMAVLIVATLAAAATRPMVPPSSPSSCGAAGAGMDAEVSSTVR